MEPQDLRIALFSGNYNYVRDGANQALNRLVGYLLRQGAKVRVYAPTVENPAFPPTGDLVSLPSRALPGSRKEYRVALPLNAATRNDLAAFGPNALHLSAPDFAAHGALKWARKQSIPVLASVHTRFETYPRYYNMAWLEPILVAMLRRYYRRCDALVAPAESMAQVLRDQRMSDDITIWTRGVDRAIFHSGARDQAWRQAQGIAADEIAIGFLGRLVLEKGLDIFAETLALLRQQGVAHKVLVIGDGPARGWLESHVPGACFAGFQAGADLGRAVASMDVLFNPSVTEAFGNVTLEAMACGVPVVAADATGSNSIVRDGQTGRLIAPRDTDAYAAALRAYIEQPALRAAHGAAGEQASLAYDWDRINQTVLDTYLRLIRQRQAGHG